LVDELVVQIYRNDPARLAWELAQPSLQAARRQVPVRLGLLAGLKHQPQDPNVLKRQLAMANGAGIAGIDLFFYESARRHFPAPSQSTIPTLPATGWAAKTRVDATPPRPAGGPGINGGGPQ
jgi:uncharacterized lipoprotein YddW (UPF0748 family)